jgi:hypothetical protein
MCISTAVAANAEAEKTAIEGNVTFMRLDSAEWCAIGHYCVSERFTRCTRVRMRGDSHKPIESAEAFGAVRLRDHTTDTCDSSLILRRPSGDSLP